MLFRSFVKIGFNDANFRQSNFIRLKILNGLCDDGFLAPDLRLAA